MTEKVLNKPMYADEIVKIFRSGLPKDELIEKISDYHTSDIADALEKEKSSTLFSVWNLLRKYFLTLKIRKSI